MVETETKIQCYESYKDSGVEWLGDIPEHWDMERLGSMLNPVSSKNHPEEILLSITREQGVIVRGLEDEDENHNYIPDDLSGYKLLKEGQFGMNKMKAWQGSYGVSEYTGIVSPAYFTFDFTKEIYPRFFHLAIRSKLYVSFFGAASDGVRVGQWDLSKGRMKMIPFAVPPLPEQTAIAQFLDDKTTKIDQAIAIKQQQIALLKERKQILIHKAVTKGVTSSAVEMKDSGVEWIGEIPEHWEICLFKRVISTIKDGTHGTYQRVSKGRVLLSAKNVHTDGIRISGEESLISEKDYLNITKNGFPKKGDLLVTCVGTIGRAFVYDLEEPLAFQLSVAFLRLNDLKADSNFFKLYIESTLYQFALKQLTKTSAQGGVYMGDIMNSIIICPPLSEQKEIANYIETASAKIETAISLKEQEISKLREYKSSLINSVVTGKVKVC